MEKITKVRFFMMGLTYNLCQPCNFTSSDFQDISLTDMNEIIFCDKFLGLNLYFLHLIKLLS